MSILEISLLLSLVIAAALVIIVVIMQREIEKVECDCKKNRDLIKNSLKKSKDVIRGQVSQEFVTMFPDFPYDMGECRFSGAPLDYIVFKGMNTLRDGGEAEIEVIFADVKVNTAQRSKVQNGIKKAIEEGRVRFETWIIDKDKKLKIK